jgi:hemolysin activation/secretion protein
MGQYSLETLYGSEKIAIGDFNTVRGFKGSSIVGDRGFYLRNDLSLADLTFIWSGLKGFRIFTGFDYGYARERAGKYANYGQGESSVIGCCAGLSYATAALSANVTYARQLFSPWFISEKEQVIYFSCTLQLTGIYKEIFAKKNE